MTMRTPPFSVRAFPGMRSPSDDFEAVRDDLQISYQYWLVDLSTARSISAGTQLTLPLKGNTLYIDQNTDVGNATAIFHDAAFLVPPNPPRFYLQPGSNVALPFDQITFENTAQAGKVLRIFYGVDIDFRPGNSNSVSLTGTVSTSEIPYTYGASYKSTTGLAANTPETVFLPAANTNGAYLHRASFQSGFSVNYQTAGFIAKTSAPANVNDGDVICGVDVAPAAGSMGAAGKLELPIKIPAGKGLYFIATGAEANAIQRSALYTLL